MFKFLFLLVSLLTFSSIDCHATWKSKSRSIIESEAKNYKSFGKAGYTSYWGGIRRRFSNRENKGNLESIKLPGLLENGLKVYFFENLKSERIHIFFPGVFGSLESEITKSVIRDLEVMGESVLVIPNFFSTEYIKAKPIYGKDSLVTDILIPLKIIDRYKKNYQKFYLYAESLGSFIGSSVLARLSNRLEFKNKKIDLTLMWPPIEINNALKNFDKNITESKKMYDDCSFIVNAFKTLYHFSKEYYPIGMDSDYLDCMDAMLYHSTFVKAMNSSYEETPSFTENTEITTFFQYLKETREDLYRNTKENTPATTLKYWLNKRKKSNTSLRIVSSVDDFLNLGLDWNKFLIEIGANAEHLVLLPWGSHSGPLGMPIWDQVYKANRGK
jgi:hypothetical protein